MCQVGLHRATRQQKQPTSSEVLEVGLLGDGVPGRVPRRRCLPRVSVASRYSADGEHAHCPKCDCERRVFKRYATKQGRQSWTCTGCGHHVHPTAGTIFDKSSTSLRLWFHAMYLMTSTRCGISAKQLERELGVHYKTAWRMFNQIRTELMNDEDEPQLRGKVEIDETS